MKRICFVLIRASALYLTKLILCYVNTTILGVSIKRKQFAFSLFHNCLLELCDLLVRSARVCCFMIEVTVGDSVEAVDQLGIWTKAKVVINFSPWKAECFCFCIQFILTHL